MTLTSSNMLSLETQAAIFSLPDAVSGKVLSLNELKSDKATVIMFICNHCPFVKHVIKEAVRIAQDYIARGVSFIAISSNDIENYPEDSPEKMNEFASKLSFPFPYLFDGTQEVAKEYKAACTPDFYIFDKNLKLAYRGQMDDSRPSNEIAVTGIDIRNALEDILKGQTISNPQKPSIGCNIKWKQ